MKQKLLLFTAVLLCIMQSYAQTGAIYNNGARIVSTSGSYWVVDNGNVALTSESAVNPANMANLSIEADASLTITPKSYLTVNGNLTNSGTNTGLVLQSTSEGTASLIHGTQDVNATIQRYVTGSASLTTMTYHLLSVPLIQDVNPLTGIFTGAYLYSFDESKIPAEAWVSLGTATNTPLSISKGYMIYVPQASNTYVFEGKINAGDFSPMVTYSGNHYNLVPNPYPSAIDWQAFPGWTKTNVDNAIYIWPSGGSNYASFVGGVSNNGGSRYIPGGQAFFVKTNAASPVLTMNDAVRVHSEKAFYKDDEWIPDLLRILATANNFTDEAVVRFTENATTIADTDFDAWKIYGSEDAPQLYTLATDSEKLAINSLPYLETAYTVLLNFEMKTEETVTFTFGNIESFDADVSIFLKDLLTNQTINLRNQQVYNFDHNPGNAANRFVLVFGGTIGINELTADAGKLWISGNTLYISASRLAGQSGLVEVYNASGQKLMSKTMVLSDLSTTELNFKGFVVAKIKAGNEFMTVKGILMK